MAKAKAGDSKSSVFRRLFEAHKDLLKVPSIAEILKMYEDETGKSATDKERGLVLVRGAVPGTKGGWVLVRDAVKRPRPKEAPKPGSFRKAEAAAGPAAPPAPEAVGAGQAEQKP